MLEKPTILVAEDLTPSQFLSLDLKNLAGMILEKTGRTSHTLILARASAIPVLSGLPLDAIARYAGQPAVLDAQCGVLAINPNDAVSGYYQVAQTLADKRQKQQAQAAAQLAYSRDNKRIDIAANIGTALEAPGAFANGAEGVGLFRTEMLYMDRDSAPDEQEQFEAYQQVLLAAGDKPIIFRTMDIGGDKSIPYLNIPPGREPVPRLSRGTYLPGICWPVPHSTAGHFARRQFRQRPVDDPDGSQPRSDLMGERRDPKSDR